MALRYSEDLDYVRATHGPIGPLFDSRRLHHRVGVPNLEAHIADPGFRRDLFDLVGEGTDFDVDEAAALVTGELLARLDEPGS